MPRVVLFRVTTLVSLLLSACVTVIDPGLLYRSLPEVTVGVPFHLLASLSRPTDFLSPNLVEVGDRLQVVGADRDAAMLLGL
jgi:hypothetical protein